MRPRWVDYQGGMPGSGRGQAREIQRVRERESEREGEGERGEINRHKGSMHLGDLSLTTDHPI